MIPFLDGPAKYWREERIFLGKRGGQEEAEIN